MVFSVLQGWTDFLGFITSVIIRKLQDGGLLRAPSINAQC